MANVTMYADPVNGNDANDGLTLEAPVKTLSSLLSKIASQVQGGAHNIVAYLRGGDFNIPSTLAITADHVASTYTLEIRNFGNEGPVISSHTDPITTGWEAVGWSPNVYKVNLASNPPHYTVRQLWDSDGNDMPRTSFSKRSKLMKINSWDNVNKQVVVNFFPNLSLPYLSEMVIPMGWNISRLKVLGVAAVGDGTYRVSFYEACRDAEFAKGDVDFIGSSPGFGLPFAVGPYHQADQYFWVENAIEFLDSPGEWYYDYVTSELYMYAPVGVYNAQDMNNKGFRFPSEVDNALFISGLDGAPVKNVRLYGLRFRNFGWTGTDNPNAIGYVGYAAGISGTVETGNWVYKYMPACVTVSYAENVSIEQCLFADLGGQALYFSNGTKEINVSECAFINVSGPALNSVASGALFDATTESQQAKNLTWYSNFVYNCAWEYTGAAVFAGPAKNFIVNNNSIFWCPQIGINFGYGGRFDPNWASGGEVSYNHIYKSMNLCTDGGAIYTNDNITNTFPMTQIATEHKYNPGLRIINNRIDTARASGFDSSGGEVTAIYMDIGAVWTIVKHNIINDADVGFLENGGRLNLIEGNKLTNVTKLNEVFFSAQNRVTDTSVTLYTAPSSPSDPAASAKFDGGTYSGVTYPPFKEMFPYASVAAMFDGGGNWVSLSTFNNNNVDQTPLTWDLGVNKRTRSLWKEFYNVRYTEPST